MTTRRWELLLPHEWVRMRKHVPVAYLPLGRLEWHGRHLPLGLDAVKAHALCLRMADRTGGVVMPPLFYGDDPTQVADLHFDNGAEISEALSIDRADYEAKTPPGGWELYERLLQSIFAEVERVGFLVAVVVAGHYPLHGPASRAAESYMRRGALKVFTCIGFDLVKDLGYQGDHAARWETSLLLALRPELVDLSHLEGREEPPLGVLGDDPRAASAEFGEEAIGHIVERVHEKVAELLREAGWPPAAA
ncbi:MAG: creatininase family protein [Armatimonadota bacterium]|nr:MAG: creatininase family protein [Armatimonadota bacterium]